jgi:hypothetical protein
MDKKLIIKVKQAPEEINFGDMLEIVGITLPRFIEIYKKHTKKDGRQIYRWLRGEKQCSVNSWKLILETFKNIK